jgi:hypothetical protein
VAAKMKREEQEEGISTMKLKAIMKIMKVTGIA